MGDMLEKISTRTWPLMTVAVILIAGFMFWLYRQSSTIEVASFGPDTTELPLIQVDSFAVDPERYSRRRVLVTPVRVVTPLGRASLALDLPGRPGYPAILDRPVLESNLQVIAGDNISIAGWVYALNDSILDVWAQRGFFEPENRESLSGYTTFFLVDSLDFVIPDQGATPGSGSGSGER